MFKGCCYIKNEKVVDASVQLSFESIPFTYLQTSIAGIQGRLTLNRFWFKGCCFYQVIVPYGIINSSSPSAAYMRQWIWSELVQIMACHLFSTKPLPEPMLAYCQLNSWKQISVKFESEFCHFHSRKCIWNCLLSQWRPFCPGGHELITIIIGIKQIPEPMLTINGILRNKMGFLRMHKCFPRYNHKIKPYI